MCFEMFCWAQLDNIHRDTCLDRDKVQISSGVSHCDGPYLCWILWFNNLAGRKVQVGPDLGVTIRTCQANCQLARCICCIYSGGLLRKHCLFPEISRSLCAFDSHNSPIHACYSGGSSRALRKQCQRERSDSSFRSRRYIGRAYTNALNSPCAGKKITSKRLTGKKSPRSIRSGTTQAAIPTITDHPTQIRYART